MYDGSNEDIIVTVTTGPLNMLYDLLYISLLKVLFHCSSLTAGGIYSLIYCSIAVASLLLSSKSPSSLLSCSRVLRSRGSADDLALLGVEGIKCYNMLLLLRREFAESITFHCSRAQLRSFNINMASELAHCNSNMCIWLSLALGLIIRHPV